MSLFTLYSPYQPAGHQPQAIHALIEGLNAQKRNQVLLGVTGSGKTFTMANVIAQMNRPTLIMVHNKTLAGQLYEEFKAFFPDNAVEYFVSYYDYYQPEAYVPRTDTFIEKESTVNEQIDRMRHAATRSLLERRDVIVVASVSCIYGIGDPESYATMVLPIAVGDTLDRDAALHRLVELQFTRNELYLERGSFRTRGDRLEVAPSHLEDTGWRIELFDDRVESIVVFDPLTGKTREKLPRVTIYPNSHYVTPKPRLEKAIMAIKAELKERLAYLENNNKLVEAQRLNARTRFDVEMMSAAGFCSGIENYSRHLTGRASGEAPPTLFDYLPADGLLMMDESHVTLPQVGGMSRGDRARKETLVDFGFRLPSAIDNRPLTFEEWDSRRPQTLYISATPGPYELALTEGAVIEQLVRPTGLIDPEVTIRPTLNQVDDLLAEIHKTIAAGYRVLVTTLTKKMAEQLTQYIDEQGVKVSYLHSDIETLERARIVRDLRMGVVDVLIGINLLREGLDMPEVALVAVLDADKEGFLRSTTALVQTIGRAARNLAGQAILYADVMTGSMQAALAETARRRAVQLAYNEAHGITPQSILKAVREDLNAVAKDAAAAREQGKNRRGPDPLDLLGHAPTEAARARLLAKLRQDMFKAAENLEFEKAAVLRDDIARLETVDLVS